MDGFGIHKIESQTPEQVNKEAERIILVSLFFLLIGYVASNFFYSKKNKAQREVGTTEEYHLRRVRGICKVLYISTYAFMCISIAEIFLYVRDSSYIDYYVSFHTRLPFLVGKLADMCPVFFFVYLSTLPSKKESMKYIITYAVYLLLTLLTGRRYEFVGGLLVLFVYFTSRDRLQLNHNRWFGKKEIIIVFIAVFFIIVLSSIVGKTRIGAQENFSDSNIFVNFFYQQGISINVLKRTIQYQDYLAKDKLYMFGSIITFIRKLFGFEAYYGNTIQNAQSGYSLAHSLSYVVLGNEYLNGRGMGSSYLAEVYFSFGYCGIIFVNFLYGVILNKLSLFNTRSIWKNTLILIMLHSLYLAPRSSFDGFIVDVLRVNTWSTLIIVYFISKMLNTKYQKLQV